MSRSREVQASMTPTEALELLRAGNRRFLRSEQEPRDWRAQVEATRDTQYPFAAVLGCIDSRAPAEILFDQGIGDLMNVRIAGNFVNDDILGSLEFACGIAGAKLVVVMGHSSCGAIKGACDGVRMGHLTGMLERIRPAVESVTEPGDPASRSSENADFVQAVSIANVLLGRDAILARSEVLRALHDEGKIDVVGAAHDLATGRIEFLP